MLSEGQILFLFLTLIADSIVLKLFFDMKWMKAVKVSLVVNFVAGLLFPIIIMPLVFIMFPIILSASEFEILGYAFAILIFIVSIKLFLVHVIFKISITKFRFLLFIITNILVLVFLYGLSEIDDKIAAKQDVKHAEELNSLIEKIPGYGGSEFRGCTMIVYLTDLKNSSVTRDLLSPKFKYHPHLRMRMCGSNATLQFKTAKYEHRELRKWYGLVVQSKVPGSKIINSPLNPNRIGIFVEKQASVPEVQEMIRDLELPLDAFVISSRESENKKFAETATLMKPVKKFETIVLPAVLWSGKQAGELILGESSLSDVQRILPPYPGYGPKKIKDSQRKKVTWYSEEMHKVSEEVKYGYAPANANISVRFNNRKKLILVSHMVPSPLATRLSDALDMVVDLQESHRDSKRLVKQGRITRCVIITTRSQFKDGIAQLSDISYFYTCETNSD